MGIQTVTTSGSGVALSNATRTQYLADYLEAAMIERLYDQYAAPIGKNMEELQKGSSVTVNFLADMTPGTSSISEVVDITAQTLGDATATLTPTSRAEALKASELLLIEAYTPYGASMYKKVGKNMMETVDLLAQAAAVKGDLVERAAARASLDAGTTSHRVSHSLFTKISAMIQTLKVPGFMGADGPVWAATIHPYVFHDILQDSDVVENVGTYQRAGIHLNWELGRLGAFRFVVSPWAKVFGGAGIDHADVCATTLSSAASALDKTITVTASTHIDSGEWITIGTEETGSTHYATNERVQVINESSAKVFNIVGEGPNGGLRFDHASGTAVRNADSVYTIVVGGPMSLAKVYATSVGEYGQIIGPRKDGTVDQWTELGWKWYGGYGRIKESGIVRAEVTVSAEA